jgi:SnoaL-like domain
MRAQNFYTTNINVLERSSWALFVPNVTGWILKVIKSAVRRLFGTTAATPVSVGHYRPRRSLPRNLSPEEAVREFFDCYTSGRPEDFDQCVSPEYVDYGHEPPGLGPAGARDDYENAVKVAGGLITYTIDGLVADGDMVAVVWAGTLPSRATFQGLSLYWVTGGLLRSTRHTLIGDIPVELTGGYRVRSGHREGSGAL